MGVKQTLISYRKISLELRYLFWLFLILKNIYVYFFFISTQASIRNVIVSGVAGRTPKNICLRCDLQFQYPAQPDTEKLEIDLRQIFFGGRPATPDTSIPQLYNQAIFGTRIRKFLNFTHAPTDKFVWIFMLKKKFKSITLPDMQMQMQMNLFDFTCQNTKLMWFNQWYQICSIIFYSF